MINSSLLTRNWRRNSRLRVLSIKSKRLSKLKSLLMRLSYKKLSKRKWMTTRLKRRSR